MAKLTTLEKFQASMPGREKFELPMGADSSVEVAVALDTGILAGTGWQVYGIDWRFALAVAPYSSVGLGNNADRSYHLQLCRGEVPDVPVLLEPEHKDLVMEDSFVMTFSTGVGMFVMEWPRRPRQAGVTTQDEMYIMFGTSNDDADISAATTQIVGAVLYDLVDSKDVGQGKGGNLSEL
jgi:hypothetical protein